MNIIPANPADFETVKRITHETIRKVYPHYYPAGAVEFFLAHHSAEKIADDLRANCVYLCQNAQGQTVGTVTLHENEIDRLFVLPEYQGQGFGRMLLDFAEAEIASTLTQSRCRPRCRQNPFT